jgi:hypothetical protein
MYMLLALSEVLCCCCHGSRLQPPRACAAFEAIVADSADAGPALAVDQERDDMIESITLRRAALQGITDRLPALLEAEQAWVAQHEGVPEEQLPPPVNEADATLGLMRGFRRASFMPMPAPKQVHHIAQACRTIEVRIDDCCPAVGVPCHVYCCCC